MINYQAIGKRIRQYRIQQELTQEYLAEKSDISITHISRIENGSAKPSLQVLVNICNVLNIAINDLMQDSLTASKNETAFQLNQLLADCTTDELHLIMEIAQVVLKNRR